jgi:hypothetical protein
MPFDGAHEVFNSFVEKYVEKENQKRLRPEKH